MIEIITKYWVQWICGIIAAGVMLWAKHVRTMKRSLSILVFALVAISNLYAQMTETPVSYAYLPGRESTLKYKFSYGEEKFFTNLRLIKGSANAFLAGDKIILEPNNRKSLF